jgi:hypothetical protein
VLEQCGIAWIEAAGGIAKDIGPCLFVMVLFLAAQVLMHRDNQQRMLALEQLLDAALAHLAEHRSDNAISKG